MPTVKKKGNFLESEEGIETKRILQTMVSDQAFNTESSYISNVELYPDNLIPFVDKHMNYLRAHPAVDPVQYVANLRLITRVRV